MDAERRLFARLEEMGIATKTVEHEPTHTVEESEHLRQTLEGGRSKSLLLTDKDGRLILATLLGTTRADLQAIAEGAGARGRLSFAKPEVMREALGVEPGHLSPFALINDTASRIGAVVVENALLDHAPIWAHPLRNDASTAISPEELLRFLDLHAQRVIRLDLAVG
ncbi:MAG: prolyl-tRNA synthetase associated domain-containing protein [Parvularcula sp.]|jgi:Ala-tRNA(Pro) deacylase|nr:prolyl-tRNA synthetase associated domain-containing protein [Parvularcula sp.]